MTEEDTSKEKPDPKTDVPKTYTQAEVDSLINIQKAKLQPFKDQIKTLETAQAEDIKPYEAIITKTVDEMSKDIPEPVKKLLAKLSPLERFEYLNDPANGIVFEKKTFPLSPKKAVDGKTEFKATPIEKFI